MTRKKIHHKIEEWFPLYWHSFLQYILSKIIILLPLVGGLINLASMSIKTIIIAAGMGTRVRPYTDTIPKCMLPVGEKTILQHQKDSFQAAGVDDFVVIKGYKEDKVVAPDFRTYINDDFENNQILESLFYAEEELEGEVIVAYGDILFESSIVKNLINTPGDIRPVIDLDWANTYDGRDQNPFTDAELSTGTKSRITAIGKEVADKWNCRGEFIGMVYLSAKGSELFRNLYKKMRDEFKNDGRKNIGRVPFRKAYFTHLLQELVLQGEDLSPCEIKAGWVEVDTEMDYEKAKKMFG